MFFQHCVIIAALAIFHSAEVLIVIAVVSLFVLPVCCGIFHSVFLAACAALNAQVQKAKQAGVTQPEQPQRNERHSSEYSQ